MKFFRKITGNRTICVACCSIACWTADIWMSFKRTTRKRSSPVMRASVAIKVGVIAQCAECFAIRGGARRDFGGIIYTESAEKVAYFIDTCNRHQTPLVCSGRLRIHGWTESGTLGIIRAGARFVEAMATAMVPKIVLTVNHASGAGYYAMAGQGFDPDFIF